MVFRPKFYIVKPYRAGRMGANEVNLGMNHAPRSASIVRPVDLQSNALLVISIYLNIYQNDLVRFCSPNTYNTVLLILHI